LDFRLPICIGKFIFLLDPSQHIGQEAEQN